MSRESDISTTAYLAANTLVHQGPCIVKSVHIAGDGENADCQVYDGVSTSGNFKAHLEVLSGTSYTWRPGDGTDFDRGIYIAVSGSGAKVTVAYQTESRKDFI